MHTDSPVVDESSARRQARTEQSFWICAAVIAHTLWTSAAPAVTYPLYAVRWELTPTVMTAIFAVYPIAVVITLTLSGNVSDFIGRRSAMLLGLGASLIGTLLFAVAFNVQCLIVGRIAMGVGVGLSASPATAALSEFSPHAKRQRASTVATAAMGIGLAAATLVGGTLVQYAPHPLYLNFWVLLALLCALFAATWRLPIGNRATAGAWRPARLALPKTEIATFVTSTLALTTGYALGAVVLSLGAKIACDLIGSTNVLVNGAAIAWYALAGSLVTAFGKRWPGYACIIAGGIATLGSMALLALSAAQHSLATFFATLTVAGIAYSLLFIGGLATFNEHTAPSDRASRLSIIYLVAYFLMGAIALALGCLATTAGLETAVNLGAAFMGLLGFAGAILALREHAR